MDSKHDILPAYRDQNIGVIYMIRGGIGSIIIFDINLVSVVTLDIMQSRQRRRYRYVALAFVRSTC